MVLLSLLGGQLLLMSTQARHPESQQSLLRSWSIGLLTPLMSLASGFGSSLNHAWENYADLRNTQRENQELRNELAGLHRQIDDLRETAAAGGRLQLALAIQNRLPVKSLIARVIGRDVTGWHQTMFINRGRLNDVPPNATVLSPTGLVGRVVNLQLYSAQVQLITDERSGVGGGRPALIGVLGRVRALGVVEGKSEQLCKMRYVSGVEPVTSGEGVFTTGQDGIYPQGIPIGRVVSVMQGNAMVSHEITIEPAADLGKLEEVIVLLERPEQIEWQAVASTARAGARLP